MDKYVKTTLLLAAMTALFMVVGNLLGGQSGMVIALGIAVVMNFGMYWFSDKMVLKMQGAQPLDAKEFPEITPMVQDLTSRIGMPMPKLYFVDTPIPNAFATGRNEAHAVVAVTRGITEILNERELKAVLAHELGHVKNKDMLVSTIAASLGGAISMLAEMAFWAGSLFGGDEDGPNPIAMLVIMLLAPLAAMIIQMAVSRSREYGADAFGAKTIGHGHDLASALQKLEDFKPAMARVQPSPAQESTAHLMFINMFNLRGISALFSTHPSTADRVARLTKM